MVMLGNQIRKEGKKGGEDDLCVVFLVMYVW